MINIQLAKDQNIHDFIKMLEAYKRFTGRPVEYAIWFGNHPNYMIDTDKETSHWIRDNVKTQTIHRREDNA